MITPDMYTDIILDHYKNPRNSGMLKNPSAHVVEYNPLCGDTIRLSLHVSKEGKITDIKFIGEGCALSQASMSLLGERVKGKKVTTIKRMKTSDIQKIMFLKTITSSRISCISLGLQALLNAITLYEKKQKNRFSRATK